MSADPVQRPGKCNKVAGNQACALMDQLIERMLAVGPGLSPVNGTSVLLDFLSLQSDVFAVAFHGQLLQICGKALEILFVRQDGDSFRAEEVVIPNCKQTHEYGQITFE